jgi:hypothetical protein
LEVLHHQKLQDGTEVREERLLAIDGLYVGGQSLKEVLAWNVSFCGFPWCSSLPGVMLFSL